MGNVDLLANVERPETDRPEPPREACKPDPSYWFGGAEARLSHWKERALKAEAELAALRRGSVRARRRTS